MHYNKFFKFTLIRTNLNLDQLKMPLYYIQKHYDFLNNMIRNSYQ